MKLRSHNGRIVRRPAVLAAATIDVADGPDRRDRPGRTGSARRRSISTAAGCVPGFIDTQVNGGGGVLFNDDINVDAIAAIGAAHARFGTTAFLPTLISDSPDQIAAALDAVDAAIAAGVPGVVGVHIEGPFINEAQARHPRGATASARSTPRLLALLTRPRARPGDADARARAVSAPHDIRTLVAHGVIVCAGHTNATYDEAAARDRRGADRLHPFVQRHVAAAPSQRRAWSARRSIRRQLVRADRRQCAPPPRRRCASRSAPRGSTGIMLVTDAMPSVGTDRREFMLQGKRIEVHDGVCTYEDGTLAGTASRHGVGVPQHRRDHRAAAGRGRADVERRPRRRSWRCRRATARSRPGTRADWVGSTPRLAAARAPGSAANGSRDAARAFARRRNRIGGKRWR